MAESKVKAAVDAVETAVEKAVEKLVGRVEVELKGAEAAVMKGVHQVFHAKGNTEFVDGKAQVTEDVAKELKDSGLVK